METGMIPPNLHYTKPVKGVKALEDGRLKVITEATPWKGGYVGINSFGFGGANCHVIVKSHTKEKINDGAKTDDLPRLVVVSGRTEESVTVFLDDVSKNFKKMENRDISSNQYIQRYNSGNEKYNFNDTYSYTIPSTSFIH